MRRANQKPAEQSTAEDKPKSKQHFPPPPTTGMRGKTIVYTRAETAEQMSAIEKMMLHRDAVWVIVKKMNEKFGISGKRTKTLVARVHENWKMQDEEAQPHRKREAMRRVFKQVRDLTDKLDDPKTKLDVRTRLQIQRTLGFYEQLLADMEGTRALKVDIDVNATVKTALVNVITTLPEDAITEYLSEYQENVRLANAYRSSEGLALPEPQKKVG